MGQTSMVPMEMFQVSFCVTCDCTLQCKLCSAAVPYIPPEKRKFSVESLLKTVDRYFQVVDHVKMITFTGGEPLLFSGLPVLLNHVKKYDARVDVLRVVTNSTIMPRQELLDAVKQFGDKFYFIIDNYGASLSPKASSIEALLKQQSIRYVSRNNTKDNPHCEGWVNCDDLFERKFTDAQAKLQFSKCGVARIADMCFTTVDGVMWPCAGLLRRKQLGYPVEKSEYVDLFDDSVSLEEQREKIRAIYKKDIFSACAYCGGFCEDSERFVPAEQLTGEELTCIRAGARSYAEVEKMMKNQSTHQTIQEA